MTVIGKARTRAVGHGRQKSSVPRAQQGGCRCEKKGGLNALDPLDIDLVENRGWELFIVRIRSEAKWMKPRRMDCDVDESLSFCVNVHRVQNWR